MPILTLDQLRKIAYSPNAPAVNAIADTADAVLPKYKLTTLGRVQGFFSVVVEETGELYALVESLNYSAERAQAVFPSYFPTVQAALPYAHDEVAMANRVYGGRMGNVNPGDGYKYRGRGLIQITGHDNYALLQKLTGLPVLDNPDLVTSNAHLLECAAALFSRYSGIYDYCDNGDWNAVWALVGSGSATGKIINLQAHQSALAKVQASILTLGPVTSGSAPQAGDTAAPTADAPSQDVPAPAPAPDLLAELKALITKYSSPHSLAG